MAQKKRDGRIENIEAYTIDKIASDKRAEICSKGGKARQQQIKERKTMREFAMMFANMQAQGNAQAALESMGLASDDQTNIAAVVLKLYHKAMTGDVMAIKLLQDMLGESFVAQNLNAIDDNVIDMAYPTVAIPDNGRNEAPKGVLTPQAGPQTMFMASSADIVIYGGAAGGGKTYAMLLEGLRHRDVRNFGGVIFRKNYNQITAEGGLWDASHKIYEQVKGAEAKKTPNLHWEFSGGGRLGFAYLEREEDLQKWMGSEICFLGFDELTHFSKHQFTYMLSRNRSTCGVRPYVRATCNPDADSWVASFISWWIDEETGYPIKERSGIVRWMIMLNDVFYWGDSPQELAEKYDVNESDCKSVTFIASRLEDNKALMLADPGYMANLKAMTELDRERLLQGNWKIKAAAGRYFKRSQIKPEQILTSRPNDLMFVCRAWDYAATDQTENGDADYTAGVMIGRCKTGRFVVLDVINVQVKAGDVGTLIASTAKRDYAIYGMSYMVRIAQDPGAAGKIVAQAFIKMLAGYNVKAEAVSGSKENRATPFAAQWQNGNVDIMAGTWNDMYFSQLESFPESAHDDMVDASSDAFNECAAADFNIDSLL